MTSRDKILVIEQDEWESALLRRVLIEAGYEVDVTETARAGFDRAKAWLPDCIVCDVTLPDIDGLWVARMVRLDPTPLAATPFLFLATEHDKDSRLQGFNVGADAFLTKPYRAEDVLAQVMALLGMAERLGNRVSFGPVSSRSPPAMRGDLEQIALSTVLTLLEMERRTGLLKVRTDNGETVCFELLSGGLARSTLDGQEHADVELLRRVFHWKQGRFWFRAVKVVAGSKPAAPIGPLLLHAMQQMDEAGRGSEE